MDDGVVAPLETLDEAAASVDEERLGFTGLSGVGLDLMVLAEDGVEIPEGAAVDNVVPDAGVLADVTLEVGALSGDPGTAGASGPLLAALSGATEAPDGSAGEILLAAGGAFVETETFSVGELLDDSSALALLG